MNIDPKTGLPLEAFAWEDIAKTEQRIQISNEKKKFGKIITVISGFRDVDLKTLAKELKHELACGGTVKGNTVELQGNHSKNAKKILVKLGFSEDTIEVL
ncbi:stress response translation initiation inhibitor YciH [Candidatus Pacearchaeota archaeon]|nr:stress response translation initiation inhibitor YciH [Candidatus Pacearchaeota archaeon]MBD3282789.1 stress response translation initiation inhibitor YciH [Candidatus Pacearchaeota archaeon]